MSVLHYGIRIARELIYPNGIHDISTEQVSRARGYGRWVYCKYCHKHRAPAMSRPNTQTGLTGHQLVCSKCGYGLAPPEREPAR